MNDFVHFIAVAKDGNGHQCSNKLAYGLNARSASRLWLGPHLDYELWTMNSPSKRTSSVVSAWLRPEMECPFADGPINEGCQRKVGL